MTARFRSGRRSSGCARRRIAARRCIAYSLKIEPPNHFINWQQDPHGNYLARLVFPETADVFSITVDLIAEMAVYNPFDFFIEEYAQTFPFAYAELLAKEISAYIGAEPAGPLLQEYLERSRAKTAARSISWSGSTRELHKKIDLCRAHGARRADAGGDAQARPRAPAATPAGCWCRSCAISASPRVSSPAI